jgi:hypothetical protein
VARHEKAVKFTISVPADVYEAIERERSAVGETRSGYVVHSIQTMLRRQQEREWDEQYRRGYEEHPETPEELAELEAWTAASAQAIYEELGPWEE